MSSQIFKDKRYLDFVEQFTGDPLKFAIMVCGLTPSQDQINLYQSIARLGAKTTVVSGTGTGKTNSFARIAMWHLLCFPAVYYENKLEIGSNTYIAAPRIQQVADGIWKEINDCDLAIRNSQYAWIAEYYEITKTRVAIKGLESQWFIAQTAMQQGQSISIAGRHRHWQMIIIDEASGVSDEHFKVVEGTQTQAGNRTLLASQGVRNAGYFYETHHNLSTDNGGSWVSLRFNSEHSPFVTNQWLKDRELETGGKDSVEYRIRVLGEFADDSGSNLLTRLDIEKAFAPREIIKPDEPYGYILSADVGLGEYRDDSVLVIAKVIGYGDFGEEARRVEFIEIPLCTNTKDEITFAGDVVNLFGKYDSPTLMVDNGGVGATVIKLIEASGVPVVRVNWGKPCFRKEYQARFYNQRACAMVRLRDAIKQGRVVLPQDLERRMQEKIKLQGSRLPYKFAELGGLRYQMEKKEEMKKNGISSPDIFDALSFVFLEDARYMACQSGEAVKVVESIKNQLDELFAGID